MNSGMTHGLPRATRGFCVIGSRALSNSDADEGGPCSAAGAAGPPGGITSVLVPPGATSGPA